MALLKFAAMRSKSLFSTGLMAPTRAVISAAGLAAMLAVSGCASNDDIDLSKYVGETDAADVLYNQGLANMSAGKLGEAGKKFDAVEKNYPYTEYARKAKLMGTFARYRQGAYSDAIASGRQYVSLYPTSEDTAYALYLIGLANYRQIQDVTRDQREARNTIAAMQELIDRYPDSEYVDDARDKMLFARDQLAGKEMQIGRYYQERREYLAAISRFRKVVEDYSNTRHVEEALARLVETYYAMGLTAEAQTAAAVLGNNFPESQWYKDSYALLQKGGLEPREVGTNWLTKAARVIAGA